MSDIPAPLRLKLDQGRSLSIDWSDDVQTEISVSVLRKNCPCAHCRELRKTVKVNRLLVLKDTGSAPLTATGARLVGHYALAIDFSDGHTSGIFTFEHLRSLASPARGAEPC